MKKNPAGIIRRRRALKNLRARPAPGFGLPRADAAPGPVERTPADVSGFFGRRPSRRRVRTQAFSSFPGRTGIIYDPAEAVAYRVRAMLATPMRVARSLDPATGRVRWYIDAETRRRWQDEACTIPLE